MNYRALGFSQRKPKVAGVYLISCERGHLGAPRHVRDGWDVALLYFYAGSFTCTYEQSEERSAWRVKSLRGIEYRWKPGMWIKGPLTADLTLNEEGVVRK